MKLLTQPFAIALLLTSCGGIRYIENPTYSTLKTESTIQVYNECITRENNMIDITPEYIFINDSVSLKILTVIRRNPNSYVYVLDRPDMLPDCLEINRVGDRIIYYYSCQEVKTVMTAQVISGLHSLNGI